MVSDIIVTILCCEKICNTIVRAHEIVYIVIDTVGFLLIFVRFLESTDYGIVSVAFLILMLWYLLQESTL